MTNKLKKLFKERFTLTELLMTIVILVTLLALGMRGIREMRSAALARMGITEMKTAVQKAYLFSLFNELPSTIQITKEDVGFAKGAILASQNFSQNGYFTLENRDQQGGGGDWFFTNNSRNHSGRLQGAFGSLADSDHWFNTTGYTGRGINLAHDDGNSSDDSLQTSFPLSPTAGPAHVDMWLYNIDKEDTDVDNNGVGHGVIFRLSNFEARMEGNRLNFYHTKTENKQIPVTDPEVDKSYISATSEVRKWWWTNVDPSEESWNKLGVSFMPSDIIVTWNGVPLELFPEEVEIREGSKMTYLGPGLGPSGNGWTDPYDFKANPNFPRTNNPIVIPRSSARSAGNNLEFGVVDNISTYDLAAGAAVKNDPKGGHYFLVNQDYEEVDSLTIELNKRGEVISPNFAFLQYIPLGEEDALETMLVRGQVSHDFHSEGETSTGNVFTIENLTFDPPELANDTTIVPTSGWFLMKCGFPNRCDGSGYNPAQPWRGARRQGEWIVYENLVFNADNSAADFTLIRRRADGRITHLGGSHSNHHSRRYNPEISFPYVVPGSVKNYVIFRAGSKPQW